jgi:hypothetical protein
MSNLAPTMEELTSNIEYNTSMSNIYNLTATIHTLAQEKAKKHGLELEIESDFFWETENNTIFIPNDIQDNQGYLCSVIEVPQIRQILLAFKDILGDNPEYTKYSKSAQFHYFLTLQKNYAEALCHKWLDGLNPLFAREPETVLQELIQILKNL